MAKKKTEENMKDDEKVSVEEDIVVEIKDSKEDKKEMKEEKADKSEKSDNKKIKKSKLEQLKERAKKLGEENVDEKKLELKRELKGEKEEKENALVPIEDYLKASVHLGTRVITPDMRNYVYRRRADGLAVFNTALLDDEIRKGAEYLSEFAADKAIIVCKREAGWKAVQKFSEITGIRAFTKKYPAGILTNSRLENFFEVDLVFICDPWLDKNALNDASRIKIPVMSICDTNNYTKGIKVKVPGNNKSSKSLGLILYLIAKIYIEKRKLDVPALSIKDFVDDWDNLIPPK